MATKQTLSAEEGRRLIPHPTDPTRYIGRVQRTPKGYRAQAFSRAYTVAEYLKAATHMMTGMPIYRANRSDAIFRVQQDFLYVQEGVPHDGE